MSVQSNWRPKNSNLQAQLQDARSQAGVDLPQGESETFRTTTRSGSPGEAGGRSGGAGSGGAKRALAWVASKVGFKETGPNSGGIASYLNRRFGMNGQPWCSMFTSAAVSKGGAPSSARTASVAEVRRKASLGEGYQRGLIPRGRARAGDLILFGNDHIGMVESVRGGKIVMVAGNDSDGVQRRTVSASSGDIVRPKYTRR